MLSIVNCAAPQGGGEHGRLFRLGGIEVRKGKGAAAHCLPGSRKPFIYVCYVQIVDLVGSSTFSLLAVLSMALGAQQDPLGFTTRRIAVTLIVSVSRLELALFLFWRVATRGKDARFDLIRDNFWVRCCAPMVVLGGDWLSLVAPSIACVCCYDENMFQFGRATDEEDVVCLNREDAGVICVRSYAPRRASWDSGRFRSSGCMASHLL